MIASPKILIIRLSSLGDILHALPALGDLRAAFPNAKIDWLVGQKAKFLLSAVKGIDEIHTLHANGLKRFSLGRSAWGGFVSLIRDLKSRRYDCAIDFQGLLKTALLGFLSGADERLGFSRGLVREPPAHWFYHRTLNRPERQCHVLELNRRLAGLAGANADSPMPELITSAEDSRFVDSLLEKEQLRDFAIINPGGGWPTKRWRPERYGALTARIEMELGLPVAVTTGPGEESFYRMIAERCGADALRPRHFALTFLQLMPLMKRARVFVGGDTGPLHLACALGTATVGIFGPTSPVRNGPWKDDDEAVAHTLDCSFCYGRRCPTNNECMDISVDEVFEAVRRRLERSGGLPVARP
jgi:lipopolysaccharide heptosyltransferase I